MVGVVCLVSCANPAMASNSDPDQGEDRVSDKQRSEQRLDARKAQRPTLLKVTADQQTTALEFAKEHHPELAALLDRLQKNSPTQFARGIREVHLAAQRLERIGQRQPARREAELKKWKLDSEIRLLTAKWVMSQDPELKQKIQQLLRERYEARIDRLKAERNRVAERLQQLDQQIGMSTEEMEADLAADWERLTRQAAAAAKDRKRPAKNVSPNNKNQKSKTEKRPKA
ncbi:hypothetical protein Fuma_03264 [Fuerstiella marisgermanici]|uniref:Uncharacterized protein n=2 Tax=Fuerstiella marisgermanici TaxID=1891926 RepID=A0A1P8WHW0_9PLAN|nr:hypothetical protein Fuma_03264 [Fuerstiella marisgermanici]